MSRQGEIMNRRWYSPIVFLLAVVVLLGGVAAGWAAPPVTRPGDVPDYFSTPNWAFSPPLTKFVDPLPGIPLAHPDIVTYPGSDYYEIDLQEYTQVMHRDLPGGTRLRGYVQFNNGTDTAGCTDPALAKPNPCTSANNTVPPEPQSYLGPLIIAVKDRAVRVKFSNRLRCGQPRQALRPRGHDHHGVGRVQHRLRPGHQAPHRSEIRHVHAEPRDPPPARRAHAVDQRRHPPPVDHPRRRGSRRRLRAGCQRLERPRHVVRRGGEPRPGRNPRREQQPRTRGADLLLDQPAERPPDVLP